MYSYFSFRFYFQVTSSSEADNTNDDELTEPSSESSNDETTSEFTTNEVNPACYQNSEHSL